MIAHEADVQSNAVIPMRSGWQHYFFFRESSPAAEIPTMNHQERIVKLYAMCYNASKYTY